MCCLCQEDKNEQLQFAPTRCTTEQDGSSMTARNMNMFQSINDIPIKLDPITLDEGGGGGGRTLPVNKAKYHQSCRGLFGDTKLAIK